jgi:hypothetical protein
LRRAQSLYRPLSCQHQKPLAPIVSPDEPLSYKRARQGAYEIRNTGLDRANMAKVRRGTQKLAIRGLAVQSMLFIPSGIGRAKRVATDFR